MPRPKCDEKPISTRMPPELKADIRQSALLGPDRTDGDVVREAIIRELKWNWVSRADWYTLRELDPTTLRKRCMTE